MPGFLAGLISAAAFRIGSIALNALTRGGQFLIALDLDEGNLLQYGGAVVLARFAWRRAVQNQAGIVNE